VKLKLNKSGFDLLHGKFLQKFNFNIKNYGINIVEKGIKDNYAFVKLQNGLIFYDLDMKSLLVNLIFRYHQSHYEINKFFKKPGIHLSHIDNLMNLPVNSELKEFLMNKIPIKSGDVVIEMGSFRGFGTIKLSQLVGKNGKIIAIESSKPNFEILKKNIEINKISNVLIVNKGIWNKKGTSLLYKEENQRTSLVKDLLKKSKNEVEIEVDTIDNILLENKVEKVDFISMEINAAEIEALKGMKNTLSKNGIRLIAAGWYDYHEQPAWKLIKKILEDYDFKVYVGKQNRIYAIKE